MAQPILRVEELKTRFATKSGAVHAVNGISFDLYPGQLIGLVGESGSGKSVAMMSIVGLIPQPPAFVSGRRLEFDGRDLLNASPSEMQSIRGGKIGFIFQDPMTSLNPVFTVGQQIQEPLKKHLGLRGKAARKRATELLELVGIPDPAQRLKDYPHQFSGGMRQRVMIAIALACDPDVLIADEPTTALDVTIQAQIIELIKELRTKLDMAIIWITHDLGVVAGIADNVMVMYGGQIVEMASVTALFSNPQHPYTKALLGTVPSLHGKRKDKLNVIEGQPPLLDADPIACPFRDRCDQRMKRCDEANPLRRPVSDRHDFACHLGDTSAKKDGPDFGQVVRV